MTHRHLARPPAERLMARVVETVGTCWVWTGSANRFGYGRIAESSTRKLLQTHRLAYETFVGPIPEGMQLDHLCRNPPCCNPAHLEVVTAKENSLRSKSPPAFNARKTHCPQGHPYDEENTYVYAGRRACRICRTVKATAYQNRSRKPRKRRSKTHCGYGHLFDEANTYLRPGGGRECLTCKRETKRRYLASKRGQPFTPSLPVAD